MPEKSFSRIVFLSCLLAVGAVSWCPPALAQPVVAGRRVYDEQLRVELDKQQAAARQIGLDGGGWFSFALFHYDDDAAGQERTLRQYELRLWGTYTEAGVHTFYVRGLVGWDDWNSGDNPEIRKDDDDFTEPEVERAWYRFDYNRLVRNRTGQDPAVGFTLKVGRDYYDIGSALVLALPLDAVTFTVNLWNWKLTGLLGRPTPTSSSRKTTPTGTAGRRCRATSTTASTSASAAAAASCCPTCATPRSWFSSAGAALPRAPARTASASGRWPSTCCWSTSSTCPGTRR